MVAVADLGGGAIASTNLDGGLELVGPTSLALKRSPTAIVVGVLWEVEYKEKGRKTTKTKLKGSSIKYTHSYLKNHY